MEGQRLRLKIKNRPWYHCLQRFQTPAVSITCIIVVVSVAIGVWTLRHERPKPPATEDSGTVFEMYKKMSMEQRIFITNMQEKLSGSPRLWTNDILDSILCCLLFPVFAIFMVGPRNFKHFRCKTADSFCGIYRRTNYIVHGVNLFLLLTFIMVAYAYLVMLYTVCAGFLESKISLSIAEARNSDDPGLDQLNFINYSDFRIHVAPYFNAKVTRYDKEDVVMTCSLIVLCKENIPTILNSFRWIKDGRAVIEKTDKIHVARYAYIFTQRSNSNCDLFIIETKLGLEVVDSDDYGNYSCEYTWAKRARSIITPFQAIPGFESMASALPLDGFTPYSLPKQTTGQDNLGEVTTEIFGNFYFQRKTMSVQEVNILPGGLFVEHVPYWSLADHVDITINETVNEDCCWLPLWFYKFFYGYRNLVSRAKFGFGRQRVLSRQQCVCSEDFALKDFFFTRTRYNSTSKSKQDIQVHYPKHFKLVFGVPNVFKMTPENDQHEPVITARELLLQGMAQFLAVFIIVLIVLRFCLRCIFEVICLPLINSLKDLFMVEHQRQGYDYDLYLTYDENDRYELALAQELKERLDRNTCRVFDAWSDVLPGYPLLDERQRAIGNSRRFCVIMSDESANDGEKFLEFTAIKQTLADRKATGTETEDCKFVIQIGNCASDGLLSPENVVMSQYFRENNTLEDSELRKFSKWARCLNRQVSFCHLMKSYGFSLKHSILVTITTIVFVTCLFYSEALRSHHVWSIKKEWRKSYYEAEE